VRIEDDSGELAFLDSPDSDPGLRRNGLLYRTKEALYFAQYDDLGGLRIDSEMLAAVQSVVDAWNILLQHATRRYKDAVYAEDDDPAAVEKTDALPLRLAPSWTQWPGPQDR
jgi:hypothetical protein